MKKSVDLRFLVVAVLFGFLGGAVSSLVLPRLAFAQGEPVEQITAKQFRVVDPQGRTLARCFIRCLQALMKSRDGDTPSRPLVLAGKRCSGHRWAVSGRSAGLCSWGWR